MRSPRPAPLVALLALALSGCGTKTKTYSSSVQILRIDPVHLDDKGEPLTADVEFEWNECPGEQREVIRGNAEFAACMLKKHRAGEALPVKVEWGWETENFDWDVVEMGGCKRDDEVIDLSSFDMVQECVALKEHGAEIGFHCDRVPQAELLQKCPWFRRR